MLNPHFQYPQQPNVNHPAYQHSQPPNFVQFQPFPPQPMTTLNAWQSHPTQMGEELVWSAPLGVAQFPAQPNVQYAGQRAPIHRQQPQPIFALPPRPAPHQQAQQWFAEMLRQSQQPQRVNPNPPLQMRLKSQMAKPPPQPPPNGDSQTAVNFGKTLIFNGANLPFRFLGSERRQSYHGNMPKVKYCESDNSLKLNGSPVLLAHPKDVVELFDQHPNSSTKRVFPPSECSTWCFRGVHVRLCETMADVKVGVVELTAFHPEVVGLDCEWHHQKPGTLALIQISSSRHCILVRVSKLGRGKYPQELRDLLSNPKIVKVGAGVKDDAEKIEKILGIPVPSTIDLNWLVAEAPMVSSGNFRRGLKKQALSFLHTKMIGDYGEYSEFVLDERGANRYTNIACSDWESEKLSMLQILYAADDAIFSYLVFMKLYLSYDRRRPCPNFDDAVYTVEPKAANILDQLGSLVDKPSWLPRHVRERLRRQEQSLNIKISAQRSRAKDIVHHELAGRFGNIIKTITACAPLDSLAQTVVLKMMDVYDTPPKTRTQV